MNLFEQRREAILLQLQLSILVATVGLYDQAWYPRVAVGALAWMYAGTLSVVALLLFCSKENLMTSKNKNVDPALAELLGRGNEAMGEPSNELRADWAEYGILAFARACRLEQDGELQEEMEIVISDFVCDLMHYCRLNNVNFDAALARGTGHFEEEKDEEEVVYSEDAEEEECEVAEEEDECDE